MHGMNWGRLLHVCHNAETALDELYREISDEILRLTAKGRTPQPTEMDYHVFWARIGKFAPRLAAAARQIGSVQTAVNWQGQLTWKVPREQRYSARQPVRDYERRLRLLNDKARRTKDALESLENRGKSPTTADLLGGAPRLTKSLSSPAGKSQTQILKEQPFDTMIAPNAPPGGTHLIGALVLILHAIAAALRKDRKKT